MGPKLICFVICALLALCDSAYVDSIKKCSIKDDECFGKTVQIIMKDIGTNGIEELNIPQVDPMDLSGLSVPVLGMLNVTILEGSITGVKDCVINHAHNDLDAREAQVDIVCDITINTKNKFDDITPAAQKLFGAEDVTGSGTLVMKIDKIHMKLKYPYEIVKKDNGDIYIALKKDGLKSDFEVENLNLKAVKLIIGKKDLSEFLEKLVNENWKSLLPTFGSSMFEVALSIINEVLGKFFNDVPAKYYVIEDLTPYL